MKYRYKPIFSFLVYIFSSTIVISWLINFWDIRDNCFANAQQKIKTFLMTLYLTQIITIWKCMYNSDAFHSVINNKNIEKIHKTFLLRSGYIFNVYTRFYLFVCLFFFVTHEIFTDMETSPLPVKNCKVWPLHSWPLGGEGFLNVPHLLWHGTSVYNSHLRRPVK